MLDHSNQPAKTIATANTPPKPGKPIGAVAVCGASTAIGKTTMADMAGSFLQAAGIAVEHVRIETGRRRAEFEARDGFIDLDQSEAAASRVGGKAALFEESWRRLNEAMRLGKAVVFDCGAGGQDLFLEVAGTTGLAGLMARRGAALCNVVMAAPDGESARQAAQLVGEIRARMPEADIVLALNHLNAGQRSGLDTPQTRSAEAILARLALPRGEIPFCGAQALELLAASRRPILDFLAAEPAALVKWTKLGELTSLAAQAHLAAWWGAIADQLSRVWRFDAAAKR